MKKPLLGFCSLCFVFFAFALTDTDADGVSDEKDICPRVYARSSTGCPTLTAPVVPVLKNTCLNAMLDEGKMIVNIVPICTNTICPKMTEVTGIQFCDGIFPVIFDASGMMLVRGPVYIYK